MNRQSSSRQTQVSKNRFGNISRSIKEIYAELGRVTWPTKEETTRLSIIVVSISIVIGLFLGVIDLAFSKIIAFFIYN
jgi:preprotein translocase subunit SecE|tara:strand:+ start:173 stop:406 length:234 start_codon:yes stop_codon:yes gene_type:complete